MAYPKFESEFYRHIEYCTYDGKLMRVHRPFTEQEPILMPMNSIEEELEQDKKRIEQIKKNGAPTIPCPNEYIEDPNELIEYHLNSALNNMQRFSEDEPQ